MRYEFIDACAAQQEGIDAQMREAQCWTVENLQRGVFLCENWDGRTTSEWVSDIKKAKRLTKSEVMHIVRLYPALDLCGRQIV